MNETGSRSRRDWLKKGALALGGAASGVWLGGCAGLLGPLTVQVAQARLMEALGARFPFRERYLELFDVTAALPRLSLLPESNRLATDLDLSVAERLTQRSFRGGLGLSHGLRFEPQDTSVRLTGLRVERLAIEGLTGRLQEQMVRVANTLAGQLFQDLPVYRFSAAQLRGPQGLRLVPGDIRVTPAGLAIALNPARSG